MRLTKYQTIAKVLALLLMISLSHVDLQASLTQTRRDMMGAAATLEPVGKLAIRGNVSVLVNGKSASSGATIFSGTRLQTPDNAGATVQLEPVGKLNVAPQTNLTLTFGEDNINVTLVTGCVILITNKGISGSAKISRETVKRTDPSRSSFIVACTSEYINGCSGESSAASTAVEEKEVTEVRCRKTCQSLFGVGCALIGLNPDAKIGLILIGGSGFFIKTSRPPAVSPMRP
jgi:hypothetical protein